MLTLKGIKKEVRVPVVAEIYEGKKSKATKVPFVMIYNRNKHSENQELLKELEERGRVLDEIKEGKLDPDTDLPGMNDLELLLDNVVGWELKDANDDEIEFTPDALEELAEVSEYREAMIKGLMDSLLAKRILTKN